MRSALSHDRRVSPTRRGILGAGLTVAAVSLLPACSEVKAEPRKIKWGRDLCEHCHMVDRKSVV
jgi:hypothetical protein